MSARDGTGLKDTDTGPTVRRERQVKDQRVAEEKGLWDREHRSPGRPGWRSVQAHRPRAPPDGHRSAEAACCGLRARPTRLGLHHCLRPRQAASYTSGWREQDLQALPGLKQEGGRTQAGWTQEATPGPQCTVHAAPASAHLPVVSPSGSKSHSCHLASPLQPSLLHSPRKGDRSGQ